MQSEATESTTTTRASEMAVAEFTVVVPTFNERENIPELLSRLEKSLRGEAWEVIFVDDDSTDGTAAQVREVARKNSRVRCLQRIGRRGLSSACVEGMLASSSPYLAVIDGDCQHDEAALPRMLELLKSGQADVVVGTRYAAGGGIGSWNASRAKMSRFATRLSRIVIKHDLSDPMSGFFAIRREVLERAVRNLSSVGFKILLDIIASSPEVPRVKEVSYEFRNRHAGESKLDGQALWAYLMLLADKFTRGIVPVRFLSFALIGAVGVIIHLSILTFLFRGISLTFTFSQAFATVIAMVSNFTMNNALTYRDKRLRGTAWVIGLVTFMLTCSFGALANVGVASFLFKRDTFWVLSALTGIVVGTVWNYAMTATFTWEKHWPKANR